MPTQTTPAARPGRRIPAIAALSAAALMAASCGAGEDSPAAESQVFATTELAAPDGQARGTVEFAEADGGTQVTVAATGLTPGFHGLHVHTTGLCEPDSANPTDPAERGAFLSAGGHLAGPDGAAGHPEHAGDLPPLFVTADGTARIVTVTDRLDRELLLDEDGSAVMIHQNSDNLANIPERYAPEGADEDTKKAGDGGSRAACGVATEKS